MPTDPHQTASLDAPGSLDEQRRALAREIRHDLRNRLNALAGYTDLTVRAGDLNPGQAKWLGRIRQLIDKLAEAADDMLDVAWLDAGLPMVRVPFDLGAVVRGAVTACGVEAQGREIALVVDLAGDLPTVQGDPAWIEQTLRALIENGLRYSASGTTVSVRTWAEAGSVRCAVRDEGIGIPESDQNYVWDRYWRSTDPRVQAVPGGGLGLSLARTVMLRHGGDLCLESMPDRGTTMTLTFPPGESTSQA